MKKTLQPRRDLLALFIQDLAPYNLLSKEASLEIAQRYGEKRNVDDRDTLVLANIRFVVSLANKFGFHKSRTHLQDLVQEGVLGLMEAAEKFTASRGAHFISYARWYVFMRLVDCTIAARSLIKKSRHMAARDRKILAHIRDLRKRAGYPDLEQVAIDLGVSLADVFTALESERADVYLSDPVLGTDDTEGPTVGESTASDEYMNGEQLTAYEEEFDALLDQLNWFYQLLCDCTPPRDVHIVCLRYGLIGGLCFKSLQKVGDVVNLTRERVRQIVAKTWSDLVNMHPNMNEDWLEHHISRLRTIMIDSGIPESALELRATEEGRLVVYVPITHSNSPAPCW